MIEPLSSTLLVLVYVVSGRELKSVARLVGACLEEKNRDMIDSL
jgi:hypothetical protein